MMKKELLKYCRYYEHNKTGKNALLYADAERTWIELSSNNDESLTNMVSDYLDADLFHYEDKDGTPLTLKSVLFNITGKHCSGGMKDRIGMFKNAYENEYMK